jgi:pimeloyl-ACP methyl ester carboxylesterase
LRFFEEGAKHFLFESSAWEASSSTADDATGGSAADKPAQMLEKQQCARPGDAGATAAGRKPGGINCPVIILHGVLDDVVPVEVSIQLVQELPAAACVQLREVPDGDHRLSRLQDLQLLTAAVSELLHGDA